MKNIKKFATIVAVSTMLSSSAYAADSMIAVGPKLGTQGIGVEARAAISDNIFGRVGINYASISSSNLESSEIKSKANLKLLTVPVMVDWHPFENNGFRLSAGIAYNDNAIKGTAKQTKDTTLFGTKYTADQIGSVSTKVKLGNNIAGIATIGYDSSFLGSSAWSFNCEAGVMYTGSPKISVSSTGTGGAIVKEAIEKDINKNNKDIKKLRLFPVLSLGFKYSF